MTRIARIRKRIADILEQRAPRERIALAVMVATVALALWAQLLWSAHHERARYARLISELQTQNGAMRQASRAMRDAKTQGKAIRPITSEQALKIFAEGLRSAGISSITVLPDAQGRLRLAGSAGFDAWLGWLAKAHADYGVEVLSVAIEPAGSPGLVKIDATIALAGAG